MARLSFWVGGGLALVASFLVWLVAVRFGLQLLWVSFRFCRLCVFQLGRPKVGVVFLLLCCVGGILSALCIFHVAFVSLRW